jgi:hypothetical protein
MKSQRRPLRPVKGYQRRHLKFQHGGFEFYMKHVIIQFTGTHICKISLYTKGNDR